ncbi:YpbF family protein [Bacillus sp. EB01]|uniref:YpbF family protein n=1 Tax=Bacillus sp. EB01 TaxID=1347086 RepID=UPI0005C46837|nr:YpbF family protein [Bacillus sp. EB01]
MEKQISMLDNRTDKATKEMLNNVVKRKKKFDEAKLKHYASITALLGVTAMYLAYLYFSIVVPYSYSFYAMFSSFVGNSLNFFFFVLTGSLYGLMILLKQQSDKKEKEYHELRCEIVDRSKDLWKKEEEWKSRHIVFDMMKKEYDINLYHEKK